MSTPLTAAKADAVYDVLVEHAGASDMVSAREEFVQLQTDRHCPEYRFVGLLGFGGKFRRGGRSDRWYVDCYPEDLTPQRQAAIDTTIKALEDLRSQHHDD